METFRETAAQFFEACETGKGWQVCAQYCHPNATFWNDAFSLKQVGWA